MSYLVTLQVADIAEDRDLEPEAACVDALHGRGWKVEVENAVHDAIVVRTLELW